MRALFGDMTLLTNMNLPNKGQVSYIPRGHIVETNAYLSENSIRPLTACDPPLAVQNLIQRVSVEQDIALDAIESGDDGLLFQAFASDALMNIPLTKARELFEKMKIACVLKYDE
jgi:galacturan 1,4-alpha-galacturonidase